MNQIRTKTPEETEAYLEENPDVAQWLKDYEPHKIALFEPFIRDSFAVVANKEMAKMLGRAT